MRVFDVKFSLWGLWSALWAGIFTLLFGSLALLFSYIYPAEAAFRWVTLLWARSILLFSGVRVVSTGAHNLPQDDGYLIMPNHISHYDILAIYAATAVHVRFVAKIELFSIPIFGRAIEAVGHIKIDRRNRESAKRSLNIAADKIQGGMPVLVFPEGTRYANRGELGPFKKGPFHLALGAKVPLVPMWIEGSDRVCPAGAIIVRPGVIKVNIQQPIYPEEFESFATDELMGIVRQRILGSPPDNVRDDEAS